MADNNNKRNVGTKQSVAYIKKMISEEAARQGVPVELALAVAQHESGFNNLAVSPKNTDGSRDHGVFQLNDRYHKLNNVYNPEENIRYGIGMLKAGLARNNGDVAKTLSDYNAGPNAKGAGRRQGDSYAKKVMALMSGFNQRELNKIAISNPKPVKTAEQEITGAAAPIGERMAEANQAQVDLANQGIGNYSSSAYDPQLGMALRALREAELNRMQNRVVNQTPLNLTPEQQHAAVQGFAQNRQDLLNLANTTQDRIQALTGEKVYQPYEDKIRAAYEAQIARLQAANPYTQMAKVAPIQALNNIDINELKARQSADRFGQALYSMQSENNPRPDYAAIRQQQLAELQQAQEFNRAQQMARARGLSPQEFIQGGLADYNAIGGALANQNQALVQLYQQAMAGDQNAAKLLAQVANTAGANLTSNVANAATALHQARQDQLNAAKENFARQMQAVQQQQGLDPYMVQGGNAVQTQNIGTAGDIYRAGLTAGVNAAGNLGQYEVGMLRGTAGATGTDADLIKPQQYGATLLNAAAQSPDPVAFENALNVYNNIARQYGNFDPRFIPANVNTFNQQQPNQ